MTDLEEKLTKRNKLLVKRLRKEQEENKRLVEEIEFLESLYLPKFKAKRKINSGEICPKCEGDLVLLEAGKTKILMCKNKGCSYKKQYKDVEGEEGVKS